MELPPLHNQADYQSVLKEVSVLMEKDPKLGTPDGDRLDALATLVKAYEDKHYPV